MLKVLFNFSERLTYSRLLEVCDLRKASVFAKVRLADVLPIDHSGLSSELFQFALQAHYDFVVTDLSHHPLFAVEFDGPLHNDDVQAERDARKDELSERFGLPLLRIKGKDLYRDEHRLDQLTWYVERWFDDRDRQLEGVEQMPRPVCPLCSAELMEKDGRFGPFLSCVRFPECKGSRDLPRPSPDTRSLKNQSQIPWAIVGSAVVGVLVLVVVIVLSTRPSHSDRPVVQPHQEPRSPVVVPELKPSPGVEKVAPAVSSSPATGSQMNFLASLIKRRGWSDAERDSQIGKILGYPRIYSELSKEEASKILDQLDDRKK